ncbi:ABC transporter permease subunit [Collimonas pratensis]|uniref:ABC transporter permease n=1 Tax=Collimonas pratensis TaxID=279113 RepID=UPI00143D05CC|nr:ABC transporter permease subunit [Collimonas pratensis]NKI72667.1 ABC transporter permease subunit [Collimonas pratensis]
MQKLFRFYLQLGFTLLVCAFLIIPIILSMLAGITDNFFIGWSSGFTARWIVQVWDTYQVTIWRSIAIALACLVVTTVAGVPLAYMLARHNGGNSRLARAIEELLMMPVAVPGLATALALIMAYGQYREFRGSLLFILVGHVLFTLPFMVRPVLAVMQSAQLPVLEEAAASLGAGPLQRFFGIVIPNVFSGILAGALMVVTLSIGEFNITWMLHTPLTMTLPVGLADSYASMRLEVGSAYTLIFFLMIIPLLIAMQWVTHTTRSRVRL